jgi:hypothetical protein
VHCPAGKRDPQQRPETRSQAFGPADGDRTGDKAGKPADNSVTRQDWTGNVGGWHHAGRDHTLASKPRETKERVVMFIFHCDIKACFALHDAAKFAAKSTWPPARSRLRLSQSGLIDGPSGLIRSRHDIK